MRRVLLLTTVMLFSASLAFAQAGSIGLFSDQGGTDCNLALAGPFNVVHVNSPGATGVQFKAPPPLCSGFTHLVDIVPFAVKVGNTDTGLAVGYGACLSSPIWVAQILVNVVGAGDACCLWSVVPDPLSLTGDVEVIDCDGNTLSSTGGSGILNHDVQICACDVPTEESTWGSIKAIYSE